MEVPVLLPKVFNYPFTYECNSQKIKNLNHKNSLNPIIVNENLYYLNKGNSLVVFN